MVDYFLILVVELITDLIDLGSVLGFSDRDTQKYYKSFNDLRGAKTLNDKLKKLVIIINLI